jgi:hypothetical protein
MSAKDINLKKNRSRLIGQNTKKWVYDYVTVH